MTRNQIIDGLKALLREQKQIRLPPDSIHEETRLDQVGFDSLSILDFLYDVENRFHIPIELPDLVRMRVVRDLIDHLEARLRG